MRDLIKGTVIRVIDGDTFDLQITHYDSDNAYSYNNIERIRIADCDEPELNTLAGLLAKKKTTDNLLYTTVTCEIQSRDVYGRLIATIKKTG